MSKWLLLIALSAEPQFGLSVGDAGQPASPPRPPPRQDRICAPLELDRSCTTDADCTFVQHMVSCCGTRAVNGISRAGLPGFTAWERDCGIHGRSCGCAEGPTQLDDGARLERDDQVLVACRANQCTTYAAPRADGACTPKECGPAPLYPTGACPDGAHWFGRGPCARVAGVCRWTRLQCP